MRADDFADREIGNWRIHMRDKVQSAWTEPRSFDL
jgi:hypothetical protein